MTYRGTVSKGVVVLEGEVRLPEGTQVMVEPITTAGPAVPDDRLFRMSELAVDTGIPDLATNIDHYLYGHPKVEDGR